MVAALIVGLLFGAGVSVSGMINPAKVLGFLDFAGDWDPTLGLVMLGALIAAAPGYALAKRLDAPLTDHRFHIPTTRHIDVPLIAGALMFGVGWGLVGFCPGPAIAAIATGLQDVLIFFAAMVAGMGFFRVFSIFRRERA
ncbi:MAG: putative membrane protein YedE/YeeE [Alphaproteobacteria bacterium]